MIAGTQIEKIIFERKLHEVKEQLREIEESVRTGIKSSPHLIPVPKVMRTITEEGSRNV